MRLRALHLCATLFVSIFLGATLLRAQSAAEYGMMTGNSTAAASSGKALVPFPNINLPAGASNSTSGPSSASAGVPGGTAESAAKENMQLFQSHSGPDAATIGLHTLPDHASVWIDGKFLGPSPVNLKLAPGHHQLLVRAPNMQESTRALDLAAKQTQSIDVALKSSYQNQVVIHWPSQK